MSAKPDIVVFPKKGGESEMRIIILNPFLLMHLSRQGFDYRVKFMQDYIGFEFQLNDKWLRAYKNFKGIDR